MRHTGCIGISVSSLCVFRVVQDSVKPLCLAVRHLWGHYGGAPSINPKARGLYWDRVVVSAELRGIKAGVFVRHTYQRSLTSTVKNMSVVDIKD
jgi:hypothetical protein